MAHLEDAQSAIYDRKLPIFAYGDYLLILLPSILPKGVIFR